MTTSEINFTGIPRLTRCDEDGVPCIVQYIEYDWFAHQCHVLLFNGRIDVLDARRVWPRMVGRPTGRDYRHVEEAYGFLFG